MSALHSRDKSPSKLVKVEETIEALVEKLLTSHKKSAQGENSSSSSSKDTQLSMSLYNLRVRTPTKVQSPNSGNKSPSKSFQHKEILEASVQKLPTSPHKKNVQVEVSSPGSSKDKECVSPHYKLRVRTPTKVKSANSRNKSPSKLFKEKHETVVEKLVTSPHKRSIQAINSSPISSKDKQLSLSYVLLTGTPTKVQSPSTSKSFNDDLGDGKMLEALEEQLLTSPPRKKARAQNASHNSSKEKQFLVSNYALRSSPKGDGYLERKTPTKLQSSSSGDKTPSKSICRSLFVDDQSDRKSLDILEAKLFTSQPRNRAQAQNSSPSSSKNKQSSILNYCLQSQGSKYNVSLGSRAASKVQTKVVKKPENKKVRSGSSKKESPNKTVLNGKISKRTKIDSNNIKTKLDGWLSKTKSKSTENNGATGNVTRKVKNKKEVLVESPDNIKTPKVKNKKEVLVESSNNIKTSVKKSRTFKRNSSGSFDKYGMCIPSLEDITAYQKKLEDAKQCINSLIMSEDLQEPLNIDEPAVPEVILDCKHLNKNEIKEAYKRNFQYVYEIFHGKRYSARHERFKEQSHTDHFTVKDLKYNISTTSFTYEQKQQILRQLHKAFDDEQGLLTNNQYFFKVLLPELCLKIFMDVHNMNCEEATTYLENRPIVR